MVDTTALRHEGSKALRGPCRFDRVRCAARSMIGQYAQEAVDGVPATDYANEAGRVSACEIFVASKAGR